MGLRPSQKRRRGRKHASTNLNITPFIDILICLILFLLVTAIYGKAGILNLYLPTESQASEPADHPSEATLMPTVAITHEGFVVNPGEGPVAKIPFGKDGYDFAKLHTQLITLRQNPKASTNIIILSEADLKYQVLVSTMDTCREYVSAEGKTLPLFPVVSVGEYRSQGSQPPSAAGAP